MSKPADHQAMLDVQKSTSIISTLPLI